MIVNTNEIGSANFFDLQNFQLNLSEISFQKDDDRYVFLCPNLLSARKLGYEIGRRISRLDIAARLSDPSPIEDLRLNGSQTSYSEEFVRDRSGKIEGIEVQIFIRYSAFDDQKKLDDAVSAVMSPTEEVK